MKTNFVKIRKSNGDQMVVKISSLLWMFRKQPNRMSPDRLLRFVREDGVHGEGDAGISKMYGIYNTISIGEWCLFWLETELIIGQVLCFQYISGKDKRRTGYRPYKLNTAPVSHPRNRNSLIVVCSWFEIDSGNQLKPHVALTPISMIL